MNLSFLRTDIRLRTVAAANILRNETRAPQAPRAVDHSLLVGTS